MELCTTPRAISNFPNHHTLLTTKPTHFRSKSSIPFRQTLLSPTITGLRSRSLYIRNTFSRASSSEETSGGANRYGVEERESVITLENVTSAEKEILNENGATEVPKEDSPTEDQTQSFEFLDQLNIKFDSDDTYSLLLYGGGALVALWLSSAIVGAIDSIPLFPKLMEVVGLGYTFWFSYRYLIFKKNREELAAKIEELKQQVLGLDDE
uniref:Cyanobacterial aminoacyl-tRNA synthetase CAAD domain-containing protein n=1 Tax=Fagus sylvatica TaxID=28930 RepID=A0A2N9EPH9_FAGSY